MPPLVRSRSSNSAFVHSLLKGSSFSTLGPTGGISWGDPLVNFDYTTWGDVWPAGNANPDDSYYFWSADFSVSPPVHTLLRWSETGGLSTVGVLPNDFDTFPPGQIDPGSNIAMGQASTTLGNDCYFIATRTQRPNPPASEVDQVIGMLSSAGTFSVITSFPSDAAAFNIVSGGGKVYFARQIAIGEWGIYEYTPGGGVTLIYTDTDNFSARPRYSTFLESCSMYMWEGANTGQLYGFRVDYGAEINWLGATTGGLHIFSGTQTNRAIGIGLNSGVGTFYISWWELTEPSIENGQNSYENVTGIKTPDAPGNDIMRGAALSNANDYIYAVRQSTTNQDLHRLPVIGGSSNKVCPLVDTAVVHSLSTINTGGWRNQGACGGGLECQGGEFTWRTPDCSSWMTILQNGSLVGAGVFAYYRKYQMVIRCTLKKDKSIDTISGDEYASMQCVWKRESGGFGYAVFLQQLPIEVESQTLTTCWKETSQLGWVPGAITCANGAAEAIQLAQALWVDDLTLDIVIDYCNKRTIDTSTPDGEIDCTGDWITSPLALFNVGDAFRFTAVT